jgi:hypothetical protein
MESKSDNDLGTASGFTVDEDDDGAFRWTAFGLAGTRQGTAASRGKPRRRPGRRSAS